MPTVLLGRSLQENLLTTLCWHERGRIVASLADPELFEGDYRLIAQAAKDYWSRYDRPPGAHTADLFAAQIERGGRQAVGIKRALADMMQLYEHLNVDYVVGQLQEFTKKQLFKDAVLRCAELLARDETATDEVETVMAEVLRAQHAQYDVGTRLDDELEPFLDSLRARHAEFITGIKPLDDAGIVPARGNVYLLIGGKGRGKSWFLVTVGRHALERRKKVLHVSLEMDEPEVRLRYYQAMWAVPRHAVRSYPTEAQPLRLPNHINVPRLRFAAARNAYEEDQDEESRPVEGVAIGKQADVIPVDFTFSSSLIRQELESRLMAMGSKASNLIIKRFPNRSLSIDGLEGYLDAMEQAENFIPDIVLLDYARLMKIPLRETGDYRIGIGHNMELLRAMAIRRNFALVTADQLNRQGNTKRQARSTDIGEDFSQTQTADISVTHSATDAERRAGLCRLYVDHARNEQDKFGLLLAQSFVTGQFCMQAARMPANYFDAIMPGDAAEADDAAASADDAEAFAPGDMIEVED